MSSKVLSHDHRSQNDNQCEYTDDSEPIMRIQNIFDDDTQQLPATLEASSAADFFETCSLPVTQESQSSQSLSPKPLSLKSLPMIVESESMFVDDESTEALCLSQETAQLKQLIEKMDAPNVKLQNSGLTNDINNNTLTQQIYNCYYRERDLFDNGNDIQMKSPEMIKFVSQTQQSSGKSFKIPEEFYDHEMSVNDDFDKINYKYANLSPVTIKTGHKDMTDDTAETLDESTNQSALSLQSFDDTDSVGSPNNPQQMVKKKRGRKKLILTKEQIEMRMIKKKMRNKEAARRLREKRCFELQNAESEMNYLKMKNVKLRHELEIITKQMDFYADFFRKQKALGKRVVTCIVSLKKVKEYLNQRSN